MPTSAKSLLATATGLGYDALSDRDLRECLLVAAQSGGSPSGGSIMFGNYAGVQPNFTPAGGTGIAIDTSNGTQWSYYNNSWN